MTPTNLAEIGRALYGERWQTALAADLGVADRTMRRWAAGTSPAPPGIEAELRRLLEERGVEIGRLLAEIEWSIAA